ncbi:MAG: radical SAM family heme chaperone HemW, partial [Lachnospiraceae bacterium]|nr:radical SAM family heme chaperone HemW [Lachnospiraceae bacterium]
MKKTLEEPIMIYVHVPFCVRKCLYCDFFSGPFGKEAEERYFESVLTEIGESPYAYTGRHVKSVFFGGGTPSSVSPNRIGEVLKHIREAFTVDRDAEITLEANPGTVTTETLSKYGEMGVNRLSFGLQSADDALLKKIGRIHTFGDFLKCFESARAAGFRNVSVDLIAGLPSDTPENFKKGLKSVLSLKPEHFSVYSLIIEENTPFYALYGPSGSKCAELPDEDSEREMIHGAKAVLEDAGYRRYEISNFALPGFESRHNNGYWTHVPYLGFGSAAASFIDGNRFKNASAIDYLDLPYEETETLSETDLENEFLMLGLRRTDGVSDGDFRSRFGRSFFEVR